MTELGGHVAIQVQIKIMYLINMEIQIHNCYKTICVLYV
jgi:hypothetical protein